jgi:hypothetical protein
MPSTIEHSPRPLPTYATRFSVDRGVLGLFLLGPEFSRSGAAAQRRIEGLQTETFDRIYRMNRISEIRPIGYQTSFSSGHPVILSNCPDSARLSALACNPSRPSTVTIPSDRIHTQAK